MSDPSCAGEAVTIAEISAARGHALREQTISAEETLKSYAELRIHASVPQKAHAGAHFVTESAKSVRGYASKTSGPRGIARPALFGGMP